MQKSINFLTAAVIVPMLIVAFGGCAGNQKNIQPAIQQMPDHEEMVPIPVTSSADNDGSLWQARSSLNGMFIDTKARNIGDIVSS